MPHDCLIANLLLFLLLDFNALQKYFLNEASALPRVLQYLPCTLIPVAPARGLKECAFSLKVILIFLPPLIVAKIFFATLTTAGRSTFSMINRREFCLSVGAALLPSARRAVAQSSSVFLERTYQNPRGDSMPYRLFVPRNYDKRGAYPLVLWLHGGRGPRSDRDKPISEGNRIGSHVWTTTGNQSGNACFVLAPQCPPNEVWADVETARPTKNLRVAYELLQDVQQNYRVDAQRLYVVGQSMGGFGTWSLIAEHPRVFAAAVPVCGGGDAAQAAKLTDIPIWAFHGEKDEAVGVERSRKMIAAIRQAGGSPKYTEYKGMGHVIWDKVFSEAALLSWIFAQNRSAGR
jgi:predicted peptidase